MTTLLQRGATWLGTRLQTSAGLSVTYKRGPQSATITAIPSWLTHTVTDAKQEQQVVRVRRYVFLTSELLFGTRAFVPRDGDLITETINGESVTFEVMQNAAAPSEQQVDQNGDLTHVYAARISR